MTTQPYLNYHDVTTESCYTGDPTEAYRQLAVLLRSPVATDLVFDYRFGISMAAGPSAYLAQYA